MLRTALLIVALAIFIAGLVALLLGHRDATPAVLWGGLVTVAILIEHWRYRTRSTAADSGGWQATEERFIDPESGLAMRVLYNPSTGERRYERADEGTA